MSTVYDGSYSNVFCCHFDQRRTCLSPGKYCEFAREFYATITAKQPKSLGRGTSTSWYFFATIS
jgi:hypothetical protein